MNQSIVIIGAGVSGLTSGVLLQEHGFETNIITKEVSPNTTSDVSAALWYPYKAEPISKVLKWGDTSIQTFQKMAENTTTGVSIIPIYELLDDFEDDPWWKDIVLDFRMAEQNELPAGYKAGYRFKASLIEMPVYMNYLKEQYLELGGCIKKLEAPLESLKPVFKNYTIVLNCTGLGSKRLIADSKLYPVRGQVVVVENIGLNHCLIDLKAKRALTYIIPRRNDCLLGGTSEDHVWEEVLSSAVKENILKKCRELVPELNNARIVSEKIGLRPARINGVRLEMKRIRDNNYIIHNYGHGGAGVTLSWGCADEVLGLVKTIPIQT